MFAVIFICGNLLLRIATQNISCHTVNTFFVSLTFDRLLVTRFIKSATIKQSWLARGLFCLTATNRLS